MEKHTFGNEYGFQTRAVHTGNDIDAETGAIKRPITMANSYALPYDPSDLNWSSAGKNLYTRNGGSNQQYLQEKLASLEGVLRPAGKRRSCDIFQCDLYCRIPPAERTAEKQVPRGHDHCGHL